MRSAYELVKLLRDTLGRDVVFYSEATNPNIDFDMIEKEWRAEQEGSDIVIDEEQPSTQETLALYDAVGWPHDPDHRNTGVGGALLDALARRGSHIRQFVMLSHDDERLKGFFESHGLREARDLDHGARAYVRVAPPEV